ncbi:glucarate dehydratase 1 [Salmonella enterica subsp. enterica serovar Pullorum]|nr:glucarate dehydratase 1 [Salmonella enterica subsp. enterica serovar Pullorum]
MSTQFTTPVVTEMQVIPVAGHDSMLMNLSGAHARSSRATSSLLKITPAIPGSARFRAAKKFAKRWKMRSHWWWEKRWVNIKMS